MKFDNALILGENTVTNAKGKVDRVAKGGYVDALRTKNLSGNKPDRPDAVNKRPSLTRRAEERTSEAAWTRAKPPGG